MKVKVVGDIDGFAIVSLREHISSLGLNAAIEVVDCNESTFDDILEIQIARRDEKASFFCAKLDTSGSFKPEDLNQLVLKCCGYKKTALSGLTVKDANNNKIKPTIQIFSNITLNGSLPDNLEYSKSTLQEYKQSLVKQRIYFDSEILSSILPSTSICFKSNGQSFELLFENSVCLVRFTPTTIPTSLDFILDRTVNDNLLKHMKIRKSHPVFDDFITGKVENIVFNKKRYKRIKENRKDMEDLVNFIEHAPKFQDSRDGIINELREFIYENYPPEYIHKYQYLEVYKSKALKIRNRNSLKRFSEL
ncbi:uncharacterized protein VICG_00447 [Vittaforma corneae ATCC 50505]|uniref:Uncharacterized protein n=1 Tax=Vittaforma corneae (strain ATCC 50505) TaxID=993615 RepID=L2GNZ5_VITCO|nr:uncharacterized protein VICG_00447 [Vittaforma corneae ATCC 50505]ELA42349.1 hypothetical protein VICG_00447 [Vittaforma corneae ATCC 50505]